MDHTSRMPPFRPRTPQEGGARSDVTMLCDTLEPPEPSPTLLARCDNCLHYGVFNSADLYECPRCGWNARIAQQSRPLHLEEYRQRSSHHRALVKEVRALRRRAYIKPRTHERPTGAASRISPPKASQFRLRAISPAASRSARDRIGCVASSDGPSAFAASPASARSCTGHIGTLVPLPWLPGRATPPPDPPTPLLCHDPIVEKVQVAPAVAPPPIPPKQSPWSLDKSIWSARCRWSDGRSLYDSAALLKRAMETDWKRATEDGNLTRHIIRDYQQSKSGAPAGIRKAAIAAIATQPTPKSGSGTPVQATVPLLPAERLGMIDEVCAVLVLHARAIYSFFDFYASLGSSGEISAHLHQQLSHG